ncbi:GNAT family N-acetyltransferase [Nocardia asteroides]|uniref:GNAT family N-acetyltransferase n=1 Tax=Nocardia asteroides TaxID=1824 RepID=UPI001E5A8B86|nr:GNAT family N-acetyltransferase [Nocardia asteroides]UGT61800.1 GNAT family N-acetyltransferase [Nocardia asteroides]
MSHVLRSLDAAAVSLVARCFDHPDAERLLSAYARERKRIVGFDDPPHSDLPCEYEPPAGLFLVAYSHDGGAVACSGYRDYPARDGVAEVRKMFVVPGHRRQGLAYLVLAALEGQPVRLKPVALYREQYQGERDHLPSIHDHPAEEPALDPAVILDYMTRVPPGLDVMESVPDLFDHSARIPGGPSLHTDGTWIWRTDSLHYLRHGHITLPTEFAHHVRQHNYVAPSLRHTDELFEAVRHWWNPVQPCHRRPIAPAAASTKTALDTGGQ